MGNLFEDFLNKKINAVDLISKLRKFNKYACFTDLNILINDIRNIIDVKSEEEAYEEILIIFYQYLDNRKSVKKDVISKMKLINKSTNKEN